MATANQASKVTMLTSPTHTLANSHSVQFSMSTHFSGLVHYDEMEKSLCLTLHAAERTLNGQLLLAVDNHSAAAVQALPCFLIKWSKLQLHAALLPQQGRTRNYQYINTKISQYVNIKFRILCYGNFSKRIPTKRQRFY